MPKMNYHILSEKGYIGILMQKLKQVRIISYSGFLSVELDHFVIH